MKAKEKDLIRERSYYTYLLVALSEMFKWELPDEIEERWVEQYLHESGSFAVQKQGDKYFIAEAPSRGEALNQFGEGTVCDAVTRGNGVQIRGVIGEEVALCFNNSLHIPDLDMIRYTDAFTQIDKAIMCNVNYTKIAPLLCTTNSLTGSKIEKLLDELFDGKMKNIVSEDVLNTLSRNSTQTTYSIDITHPERIKNVQYQSELYDVLLRRFFNKYGLNIQNSSKHAQASVDEVHGLDAVAWALPLNMLKERKAFCDVINRITGENKWSVSFSELWQKEYDNFFNPVEEEQTTEENNQEEGEQVEEVDET